MESRTYSYIYREPLGGGSSVSPTEPAKRPLTLKMEDATKTPLGAHSHEVTLTPEEVELAKGGTPIKSLTTTTGAGRQHTFIVAWKSNTWRINYCAGGCDVSMYRCCDKHSMFLNEVPNV